MVQDGWVRPPITGAELAEWEAFERDFGPIVIHERVDFSGAVLATILANVYRGKDREAYEVGDFLPKWGGEKAPPPPKQSPEEVMAIAGAIVKAAQTAAKKKADRAAKRASSG